MKIFKRNTQNIQHRIEDVRLKFKREVNGRILDWELSLSAVSRSWKNSKIIDGGAEGQISMCEGVSSLVPTY